MRAIPLGRVCAHRPLFLIDGLGALLSAFLLGVVLVRFESRFGMAAQTLYILASIAVGLCLYSLSCCLLDVKRWRIFMQCIAAANLSYCALTGGLIAYSHDLTLLGYGYFLIEILVVVALATVEFKTAKEPEAGAG